MSRTAVRAAALICLASAAAVCELTLFAPLDHPAIYYSTAPVNDPVAVLNRSLREGRAQLSFDGPQGYLRSVLAKLNVPIESQMLIFSKTSLQAKIIGPRNPRSIFFNDIVCVAWVPGEPFVEVAAQDPQQGVHFYTLNQRPAEKPQFIPAQGCLQCHDVGIPGMIVRSIFPAPDGTVIARLGNHNADDHTPIDQRWGGWYVTAKQARLHHMGNSVFNESAVPVPLTTNNIPTEAYLSPHSDIVALMVFEHQARMMNLLTAVNWQWRIASYEKGPRATVDETLSALVDYMLFVGEAPLQSRIEGASGFAEQFQIQGPRDLEGRSLRDLDLKNRLLRFPCSYMIYSPAFDGMPSSAKDAIYLRMWRILSGSDHDKKYAQLSVADRGAIVEILRETKTGLPGYFQPIRQ